MSTEENLLNTTSVVLNDDCCELVFEYLALEDKCRLERVSEQFKKLVYLKETKLYLTFCSVRTDIDEKRVVNIDRLKCILKKCSNIKRIDWNNVLFNDRVLDVITDCCQRLQEIQFNVEDLTNEAITRFSQKLGHKMIHIHIDDYEDDSIHENQQILFSLCHNISSINCRHFLSLNVIASKHIKRLIFRIHLWSDNEIQAFVRFVDMNDNNLIRLEITTHIHIYHHLDDIPRHVNGLTNLKFFRFIETSREQINISTQGLIDLVPVCKKLKKVLLCVNIISIYGKHSDISMHSKN